MTGVAQSILTRSQAAEAGTAAALYLTKHRKLPVTMRSDVADVESGLALARVGARQACLVVGHTQDQQLLREVTKLALRKRWATVLDALQSNTALPDDAQVAIVQWWGSRPTTSFAYGFLQWCGKPAVEALFRGDRQVSAYEDSALTERVVQWQDNTLAQLRCAASWKLAPVSLAVALNEGKMPGMSLADAVLRNTSPQLLRGVLDDTECVSGELIQAMHQQPELPVLRYGMRPRWQQPDTTVKPEPQAKDLIMAKPTRLTVLVLVTLAPVLSVDERAAVAQFAASCHDSVLVTALLKSSYEWAEADQRALIASVSFRSVGWVDILATRKLHPDDMWGVLQTGDLWRLRWFSGGLATKPEAAQIPAFLALLMRGSSQSEGVHLRAELQALERSSGSESLGDPALFPQMPWADDVVEALGSAALSYGMSSKSWWIDAALASYFADRLPKLFGTHRGMWSLAASLWPEWSTSFQTLVGATAGAVLSE